MKSKTQSKVKNYNYVIVLNLQGILDPLSKSGP